MNTKQQNALRSLLKKYQYKNVSNMVRMALGINYEVFLQKTEPLYVIPRIASCYAEDSDVKKRLNNEVYKEWLDMLVTKRWVKPVNVYIDQFGAKTVLNAIYYLIDNDLWATYEGRLSLDAQESDYYDKLEDMPSAIAMIREQEEEVQKQDTPTDVAPVQENTPPETSDNDLPFGVEPVLNAEEASKLASQTTELCMNLRDSVMRLTGYITDASQVDDLRQLISRQEKMLAVQREQHQKEITALQQQLDEQKVKADDANATMLKASDYIAKQKEEAKEAQKQYDELNAKYKKALDERDAADRDLAACKKLLDEEAAHEQLPKKKVIPYSVLDAVPLLGKGVMTGLVPVLARYNIVVDYNR